MKSLKSKFKLLSSVLVVGLLLYSCNQENTKDSINQESTTDSINSESASLSGPYLGQKLPGTTPEIFAPGIISTDMYERDLTITPDGKEIYFTVQLGPRHKWKSHIVCVEQINGVWSKPEVASFSGQYSDIEPFIQFDGKKMYFISNRPLVEGEKNKYRTNMWYVDKTEKGWSEPKPVGEPINGNGPVFFPSITKSGTMYFTRGTEDKSELIYRSKFIDGSFTEPELLPKEINATKYQYNTFISPDEDFLIVPTNIENNTFGGGSDYYISFRDENDNWSELINLGDKINNAGSDHSPSLSPDGKYFFFQREAWAEHLTKKSLKYNDLIDIHNGGGDIYWVDAEVIKSLNPNKKL
ncbi:MAG: hypothetical protein GY756_27270 [bacterium]|nr:hypothetical protein [bacterium]